MRPMSDEPRWHVGRPEDADDEPPEGEAEDGAPEGAEGTEPAEDD